jgi:plasmid stability protein
MKALTIRRVDSDLARSLEQERRRRGTSLNETVLALLRQALGLGEEPRSNGLRALAGTWSAQDLEEFERAMEPFEQVDPELWS